MFDMTRRIQRFRDEQHQFGRKLLRVDSVLGAVSCFFIFASYALFCRCLPLTLLYSTSFADIHFGNVNLAGSNCGPLLDFGEVVPAAAVRASPGLAR